MFLQKTAFSLVKSRLALKSHCCLVVHSFVQVSPCRKLPNTQENSCWAPLSAHIHRWHPFPDQERGIIGPASLLHSWHWVLFLSFLIPVSTQGLVWIFMRLFFSKRRKGQKAKMPGEQMLTCGEKEIFQEIQELGKLTTENTKLGEIQEQSHFHWNLFTKGLLWWFQKCDFVICAIISFQNRRYITVNLKYVTISAAKIQ